MHFGLTEERSLVLDIVRGFVEKEMHLHEQEVERSGRGRGRFAEQRTPVWKGR